MTTRSLRSVHSRGSIRHSFRSRRSSLGPDDSVFSDDHAPDSPISIDEAPLGDFPPPRQQYFDNPFHDPQPSPVTPSADLPSQHLERSSTAKRRLMIDDVPTSSAGVLGRSQSTSSRITIPRSQSPYNGPTAPSHPYAMYPQMTRTSSIASESTIRPVSEVPFVPQDGPQHPYQMYPQNTLPEEDDEDITANGIPLGFPRTNFQSSSGGSSSDVGDIIGSDGHIEQLPPYTRYADNTVAKGNMDDINGRRRSQALSQTTDTTSGAALPSNAPSTTLLQPTEHFEQETEAQRARKEGYRGSWKDTLMRPTIAGMPLWGLLVVTIIVIFSAVVGGVVGGVIGNRQGQQLAYANGALTTIWLDATPTTTGPNTSPLPTGHFQISFNQTQEINDCMSNKALMGPAWGCMDIAYIGVNVFEDKASGTMQASLEDFSANTMDFKYGPQPPDFNGSAFTLQPMADKDANDLGVAMFFSVLFDKLSIIPEDALQVSPGKRELDGSQFQRRSPAPYDGAPLRPSDKPWFCFWNSTINEFFVYLSEDAPTRTTSSPYKMADYTSSTPGLTTPFTSTTPGVLLQELAMTTAPTQSPTSFPAYNPIYNAEDEPPTPVRKRGYDTSAPNVTNYPKLIKMVEKRKPADQSAIHIQPYCQMMQVLDNWDIVPIPTVEKLCIEEIQYPTSTTTGVIKKHYEHKREQGNDVISDLESYCICEWTSH